MQTIREKQIAGAKLYAASDRSDPFAFSRAMSHINNGCCRDEDGLEQVYCNARRDIETRTLDPGMVFSDGSNTHPVTVYRDVSRL